MLNSRFELSKIEKNTRVEREICLATLENREWKENLFLPLSKIESRKRIVSCHSQKSRVEREFCLATFENREKREKWKLSNFRDQERNFSFYSRFFSRERDSRQCVLKRPNMCYIFEKHAIQGYRI